MATAEATLTLGEVFLETADGTRISLGQLKAPFNITIEPPKEKPTEIKVGSKVLISDNPGCSADNETDGCVGREFAGQKGTVIAREANDWRVKVPGLGSAYIAAKHLTVVS